MLYSAKFYFTGEVMVPMNGTVRISLYTSGFGDVFTEIPLEGEIITFPYLFNDRYASTNDLKNVYTITVDYNEMTREIIFTADNSVLEGAYLTLENTAGEGLYVRDNTAYFQPVIKYITQIQLPSGNTLTIKDDALTIKVEDLNTKVDNLSNTNKSTPITTLDNSAGTKTLESNHVYSLSAPAGDITFTLPTTVDNNIFNQILVQLNLTSVVAINVGTTYFFNKKQPDFSTTGIYNVIFEWDSFLGGWVCGTVTKGTV